MFKGNAERTYRGFLSDREVQCRAFGESVWKKKE